MLGFPDPKELLHVPDDDDLDLIRSGKMRVWLLLHHACWILPPRAVRRRVTQYVSDVPPEWSIKALDRSWEDRRIVEPQQVQEVD